MEDMNFDEMRNQIAILKGKLDKQEIVNEKMMHEVISAKANNMKRIMLSSIVGGIIVIFISPIVFHRNAGASWAFVIATDILMIYCIMRDYLFKRRINDKALMNASLLDVAKKMKDFKKSYRSYQLSTIPITIVWAAWLIIEVYKNNPMLRTYLISGLIIGLCIGTIVGLKLYFRIQNEASDIIKQIEE